MRVGPYSNRAGILLKRGRGTCLLVQWLRRHASNARDMGSISHRGTKSPHAPWQIIHEQWCQKKKKIERDPGALFPHTRKEEVMWAHREMAATNKEREGTSEWNQLCTFILDFPGSRAVGNRFLWLKPPGLGHFVMAALADWSGEGNGNPLQYSCLENPMDGGAW